MVGNEKIRTTTKAKGLKLVEFSGAQKNTQIAVISRFGIEASGAADTNGRLIGEWFMKLEFAIGRDAGHEVIYPCSV